MGALRQVCAMIADLQSAQRISHLTPLAEVLDAIARQVRPVAARDADVADSLYRILADDVRATASFPAKPIALKDGFALQADAVADASSYSPVALPRMPVRVDAGDTLPDQTDAVAPLDSITVRNERAEATASVVAGENVLAAGAEANSDEPLRRTGDILRASDVALLAALGIARVRIREPRLRVVRASQAPMTLATTAMITSAMSRAGGIPVLDGKNDLEAALRDERADAVIAIGGTGSGRNDASVETLRQNGRVLYHGVGLMPGETSAFGFSGARPVLLVPGRIDAALSAWLLLGQKLFRQLSAAAGSDIFFAGTLTRKITSTIGIAEVIPVRRIGDKLEPLANGYWPLQTLAHADGWVLVPADSEGYPPGTSVAMRPLP